MKLNWAAAVAIVGIATPVLAWAVSVESRLSHTARIEALTERIEQLENALLPVLIEYRVTQTVKELEKSRPKPSSSLKIDETKARAGAEKWARSQLPNVQE